MKYRLEPRQLGKSWSRYILAAVRMGIPPGVIKWRIDNGWPIDKLHVNTLEGL